MGNNKKEIASRKKKVASSVEELDTIFKDMLAEMAPLDLFFGAVDKPSNNVRIEDEEIRDVEINVVEAVKQIETKGDL